MDANPDKITSYYIGNAINPALVDTLAKKWANAFYPPGGKAGNERGKKPIKASQLRKFYGEVKKLEMRWQNSGKRGQAFGEILPLIKLLKAKAAYANSRDYVPDSFRTWIWDNVDLIKADKDFQAFLLYFEAVVGFCYGNGLTDNS